VPLFLLLFLDFFVFGASSETEGTSSEGVSRSVAVGASAREGEGSGTVSSTADVVLSAEDSASIVGAVTFLSSEISPCDGSPIGPLSVTRLGSTTGTSSACSIAGVLGAVTNGVSS
jgi:hypothetical protein